MPSKRPSSGIPDVIHAALKAHGIRGELNVQMDGLTSTSWIGKPHEDDLLIEVKVGRLVGTMPPTAVMEAKA